MGYRILIVDDEHEIANGLRFLIDRYCRDYEIAGIAHDGREAEKLLEETEASVVITDIRMPDEDGLTMIQHVRQGGRSPHFIILSGYADFAYAQRAISLGVEEFLLKPVSVEELQKTLERVAEQISKEEAETRRQQSMKEELREVYLQHFLLKGENEESISEILQGAGFPMGGVRYVCLCLDGEATAEREPAEGTNAGMLSDEAGELLRGWTQGTVLVPYEDGRLAALLALRGELTGTDLVYRAERLRTDLARKCGVHCGIGIGLCVDHWRDLPQSFEQARISLNYRIVKGANTSIAYADISAIEEKPQLISQDNMLELEESIDRLDNEGCRRCIRKIFDEIRMWDDVALEDLQRTAIGIVLFSIRRVPSAQYQLNRYLGKNIFTLENIEKFKTLDQLCNWITNMICAMNELMLKDNLPDKRDLIEEAKSYIRKNYNKDISLQKMAELLYINPFYLSQLFKKKTGKTYQSYLTDIRLGRARKLLEQTDLKPEEVCEMVGYRDVKYFKEKLREAQRAASGQEPAEG